MREAYRSSHLLLHTSWTEGLPHVLIEAFAASGMGAAYARRAVLTHAEDHSFAAHHGQCGQGDRNRMRAQ
jgi:hypothetical protein